MSLSVGTPRFLAPRSPSRRPRGSPAGESRGAAEGTSVVRGVLVVRVPRLAILSGVLVLAWGEGRALAAVGRQSLPGRRRAGSFRRPLRALARLSRARALRR